MKKSKTRIVFSLMIYILELKCCVFKMDLYVSNYMISLGNFKKKYLFCSVLTLINGSTHKVLPLINYANQTENAGLEGDENDRRRRRMKGVRGRAETGSTRKHL